MSIRPHIIGSHIYRVCSIPSTNTALLENTDHYEHGAVLVADRQTAGLGRRQRNWSSEKGGLYMSILLKHVDISRILLPFCLLSALAVVRTVEKHIPSELSIKWPNDVYAEDNKICGILPQSTACGDETHGVIGIGLNVNNPVKGLKELRQPAVSIKDISGAAADIKHILHTLITCLDRYYDGLREHGLANYLPELNNVLYRKGRTAILRTGEHEQKIIPLAFTEDAGLSCLRDNKKTRLYWGEI
ncbi:MAG: biotin--[acetyl-CoA-carboxylase] ligase [Candidatus Marinimicrobia bacterium]|nr:biotin--[acetyl-CoA-carboxylase] ligase [Candidatus Neomarinimicrobiota bacterium]